jgi:carboxylesterase type B
LEGYEKKGRKSGAIGGDLVMIAQRRKVAQAYTKVGQKVWSYRFDTPLWNSKPSDGSRHSAEMVFSFQNITGMLGPVPAFQHHQRLSEGIGASYVNFVNHWDPNMIGNGSKSILPKWPSYGESPVNMVFNASNNHVEKDDWRKEGMAFINSISRELLS